MAITYSWDESVIYVLYILFVTNDNDIYINSTDFWPRAHARQVHRVDNPRDLTLSFANKRSTK